MNDSERIWREDAERHGWVMPSAVWWKRLPVVRRIRCACLGMKASQFREITKAAGLGIGGVPQYDRWVLYGIARGYERSK